MSRVVKVIFLGVFALLVTFCLIFMIANLNALNENTPVNTAVDAVEDLTRENRERVEILRQAPWQGLRYLREERTWRFYGLAGETQEIDVIQPMTLIKIFYLTTDGELTFTWAATEIRFRGKPVYPLAKEAIQEGQLVAVQLQGDYIVPSGVYWKDCQLEYCRIAEMIDTRLVLDDKGTGISNGFIRYGWAPPTYPLYGFLLWQIYPVENQEQDLVTGKRG
jgi:hypothetical protein